MKILITASDSAIGKCFTEKYSGKHNIVAVEKYDYDLTNIKQVIEMIAIHRPQVVIHLDYIREDKNLKGGYDKDLEIYNVSSFKNIQSVCKSYGVNKLFCIGSGREYSATSLVDIEEADIQDRPPFDSYAYSKYIITKLSQNDGLTTAFRLFDLFGRYCDDGNSYVMNLIKKAENNEPFLFDRERKFSSVYIEDFVNILEQFAASDLPKGVYNVTDTEIFTTTSIVKQIRKTSSKLIKMTFENEEPVERTVCNIKLRSVLPNLEFTPLRISIGRTFKYAAGKDKLKVERPLNDFIAKKTEDNFAGLDENSSNDIDESIEDKIYEENTEPEVIVEEYAEPEVINEENIEPEVISEDNVEQEVVIEENIEPEVISEDNVEQEVVIEENIEPEVISEDNAEPEVISEDNVEPEVVIEENTEPEVVIEENTEPEVISEDNVEPEVVIEENAEPEVISEENAEPETIDADYNETDYGDASEEYNENGGEADYYTVVDDGAFYAETENNFKDFWEFFKNNG